MQSVSLYVHVLLLTIVVATIIKIVSVRRKAKRVAQYNTNLEQDNPNLSSSQDEVIAVRKLIPDDDLEDMLPTLQPFEKTLELENNIPETDINYVKESVMLFLLAKDNRTFAGYELLQALLSAGFRYGEGQLFHRHQAITGHGPVLFSLAAATATGTFDLQNIGAFSERGLCLFMETSGSTNIDAARFNLMLSVGRQLSETFDALLLDDKRVAFSNQSLERYQRVLNIDPLKVLEEEIVE